MSKIAVTRRSGLGKYDEAAWEVFAALCLSPIRRPAAVSYRILQQVAADEGWTVPSRTTLMRRLAKTDTSEKADIIRRVASRERLRRGAPR